MGWEKRERRTGRRTERKEDSRRGSKEYLSPFILSLSTDSTSLQCLNIPFLIYA
jgi:hypothetical protein